MTFTLHHGDCIEVMRTMPDNCVDSIVTDPPYELGFMGKSWDSTGIAYNVEMWTEALRVLKPGGHLLAFSGSRTYHRMACAIEDAGFQIRDQIMWLYGSGFPKSHNVSKGIDKSAGAEREVIGSRPLTGNGKTLKSGFHQPDGTGAGETIKEDIFEFTAPATEEAKQWDGWGTALKPAHEPIVMARKPLSEKTVAKNVLQHGTGALNIDGSRISSTENLNGGAYAKNGTERDDGWGMQRGGAGKYEQPQGRWPANVIHDGSDEVVDGFPDSKGGAYPAKRGQAVNTAFAGGQETEGGFRAMGDDGSAARFFYCAKANKRDRNEGLDGFEQRTWQDQGFRDNETSHLSPRAGAGRTSTNANHHPTVKPVDLMRYLVKLITPPDGTVLDPFMGSGSTGKGAVIEGFNFVGIERDADYLDIARARIQWACDQEVQLTINGGAK